MNTGQRFKANHPCPVCGGHDSQPHGEGIRCYGFLSDDGLYAHCTRENYAGKLVLKPKSDTYAHLLIGVCLCGEEHGSVVDAAPHKTLGGQSIDTYHDPKLGKPTRLWPYRYANGTLACYVARWDLPVGGKEIRPLVLENGMWKQGGISQPLPLYNLPALVERPDAPVLVVEGEKTSDAAGEIFQSLVSTTSMYGAKSPNQSDWAPVKDREVVIWPDNDPDGQGYARKVASLALEAGASGVCLVQLPEELPFKWDLADPVPEGVDLEWFLVLAERYVPNKEEPEADGKEGGRGGRVSAGDELIRWTMECVELYRDGEETFADIMIEGNRVTLAIRSKGFRRWLQRLCWKRTGQAASKEALSRAVENLDAQAEPAEKQRVYLRVASHDEKLYIDLGDDTRRVVEIDLEGWRALEEPPPVRFRWTPNSRALPTPLKGDAGKGIRALRSFLNVGDDDFMLCVAWLLAALRDTGPYPLLVLTGEQGSAKSTAARLLRSLVDPARPPTRGMPQNERDLAIAAKWRHVLVFDNLSGMPTWLSNALCRIAMGAGFGTRTLYSDDDETVFEGSRPVILTGIENPAIRGDLADRSLVIRLKPIAEKERRTETEVEEEFEKVRPLIFGALLEGLSEGLRRYNSVKPERLPRMADFCKWAVACEGAYWPAGTFMEAYDEAQASATEDVLEESPIVPALRRYLEETKESFEGSAEELLKRLSDRRLDKGNDRGWPTTGATLGKQLKRLAPSLRRLGYTVEPKRKKQSNVWELKSPPETAGSVKEAGEEEADESDEG